MPRMQPNCDACSRHECSPTWNATHAAQLQRMLPPRMLPKLECHACSPTAYRSWWSRTHSSTLECLGGHANSKSNGRDGAQRTRRLDFDHRTHVRCMAWHFVSDEVQRSSNGRGEYRLLEASGWEGRRSTVSPSATVKSCTFSFGGPPRSTAWNSAGGLTPTEPQTSRRRDVSIRARRSGLPSARARTHVVCPHLLRPPTCSATSRRTCIQVLKRIAQPADTRHSSPHGDRGGGDRGGGGGSGGGACGGAR